MYPLVLIKSFGKEKSYNIINEILRANGDSCADSKTASFGSYDFTTYKLSISTRYYKTTVLLFECSDLNLIPNAVKSKIEGCIFYFDSNDLQFLYEVKNLVKFVSDNHVGVSTLITRNISEHELNGISYDEIKNICKLDLHMVDLNSKSDNEQEAVGYAEVVELLQNHIWSSVDISNQNSNQIYEIENNDEDAEKALNEFEDLLNKFHQFKDVSPNMCREEVLQNAENLAFLFAKMLNED